VAQSLRNKFKIPQQFITTKAAYFKTEAVIATKLQENRENCIIKNVTKYLDDQIKENEIGRKGRMCHEPSVSKKKKKKGKVFLG
jgi:hypothetical protein